MPLPSALTTTQKNNLRAERYQARPILAMNPNAIVGTARINQTSFGASVAQLTFDTGSGMSNTLVGQTVYISRTNDIRRAYFRGRVRKAVSGATLFINETSASFADDDYIFIINDVALHPKLPRSADGVDYIDYDETFRQMLPVIYGLQSAYVITLDGTPKADLALAPSAYTTTQGASISTWSWSAPSATFQVGSNSTQNVTLRWTTAGVYWVRLTVTDNGARSNFLTFPVFVCSADYSDTFLYTGLDDLVISGGEGGWTCDFSAFDGVQNVLDQTLAVVFSLETIGTSTAPIVSNINFVGRLRNNNITADSDSTYLNIQNTRIRCEDILAQMGRTRLTSWSWTDADSPTAWGDINNLTLWRAIASLATDFSTLSNVSSLQFDSTANTYRTYDLDQASDVLLDGLNNLADAINARATPSTQGELFVYRSARFLSASARNALTTVMDFTLQDMLEFDIAIDPARLLGRQITYGGSYNTTSKGQDIYEAVAPAVVPTEGASTNETSNQVLTANLSIADAQAEIGARVADDFEARNPITKLRATLHDGFHFLMPNNFQWYTFTIGASDNNRGISYSSSDRWLCESVSCRYNPNGTWEVGAEFGIETQGGNFKVVANIAPNEEPYYAPPYPIDDPYPFFPDDGAFFPDDNPNPDELPAITPKDTQPIKNPSQTSQQIAGGDVVMVWDSSSVWLSRDYTKSDSPTWQKVLSASGITDCKFANVGNYAYAVANDGTDSTFYRTTDIFAGNPSWQSTSLSGVYTQLRTTDASGEVYIYQPNGTWVNALDFTSSNQSFSANIGSYSLGTGFVHGDTFVDGFYLRAVDIDRAFGVLSVTRVRMTYNLTKGTYDAGVVAAARIVFDGVSVAFEPKTTADGIGKTLEWTGTQTINELQLIVNVSRSASMTYSGAGQITAVEIEGNLANVRRSTDNGATFTNPQEVGTTIGTDSGFDTQRIGNLVFASQDGKVRQATDGGAFADTTDGGTAGTYPLLVRSYGQSGTNLIIGSAAAVSGETLWRVSGGSTAITPNDGANDGLAVSPQCVDMWITSNNNIIGIFSFAGVYKLGRSSDGGASWTFTTTNITTSSKHLRVRQSDTQRKQVYAIQAGLGLYSNNGGSSVMTKTAPSANLIGIEVKS